VEVLILQVFVSLMLVLASVMLFVFTARQRSFDHADRLALLPVEDDVAPLAPPGAPNSAEQSAQNSEGKGS
jgi:hypothetical protein